jgi:hypothetical protein
MPNLTKFNSQLEVTQTVTLGGSLDVTGTTTFNDQVAIVATNDTVSIVATGVSITGSTTITGAVQINGDTTITGTVTISGSIYVAATASFQGEISCNSIQLPSPSDKITDMLTQTSQINFGSVAGGAVATIGVVVTGALLSSFNVVIVDTPDILNDVFILDGVVTADDTVSLKLHNTSNGTENAITATYRIAVLQFT